MKKLNNKGFTLVELIIVIAILAIIMMIAIPNYSKIRRTSQVRTDKVTAGNIGHAVRVWITDAQADGKYVDINAANGSTAATHYEDLEGLTSYIAAGFRPQSLTSKVGEKVIKPENARFNVIMDGPGADAKVMVVIEGVADAENVGEGDTWDMTTATIANYNGVGAGVAWIEGAPATGDASTSVAASTSAT